MIAVLLALGFVIVAVVQVTVAPLFPLGLAQADVLLVSLALVTVFAGRRASLVSVPIIAVVLGFLSGRSIGLLALAFLPFPPLAGWLADGGPPLNRYLQTLSAVALTGLWARLLLAMSVVVGGADFDLSVLLVGYLLPGAVLDGALLSACYFPCRFFGLVPADLNPTLQRYRI